MNDSIDKTLSAGVDPEIPCSMVNDGTKENIIQRWKEDNKIVCIILIFNFIMMFLSPEASHYKWGKFYIILVFIEIQLTYNIMLVTGVRQSVFLFFVFCFFVFFWQSVLTFKYILEWSLQCLVTICPHKKLLQCYWWYSLCCITHPHDFYFLTGSLNLLIPFTYFAPMPPPLW